MALHEHEVDRRTLFRVGLGTAVAAVVGTELTFSGAAEAAPSAEFPWIIDCDTWGARPPSSPIQITGNTTNKIILHHMAFPNVTDYSREHAVQLAKDCQDLHMDGNGWADTGQHFTVSRGGYVMEGRHRSLETLVAGEHQVVSAHCPGENGNAIGIENEGTYITETPPEALLDSLVQLCVAVCRKFDLNAWDIFGHWDFRITDCPGIAFYAQFPMIRTRVLHELGVDPKAAPDRRWPDIWRFVDSPVVQVGQYLLDNAGYALTANGVFGYDMNAALADFQTTRGIPVTADATFDTATWEALAPPLDKDASGLPVTALQFMLARKGYSEVTASGEYDHPTMKAVQSMQHLHGLTPNGKVDLSTWCAVVGGSVREAFCR
ncbi:N-acetylmuramoyl-L-alanine amidase [Streptomyces cocklensis]|uniref:Peptidoglycan-binding (PGRP) domain of peptidoglycan hydrolases-containing protein n=1 Tax=Actinacidiphila cocklensis TaxID=887465 RepID=A0A9W4E0X1_9ACTN|nr:peptidoglycan-binding protein [Actinacidiphila cocklensis]MDD1061971.1 N-acetylmuramoyl-L-alanine amidase [Actinacidiphila cocklensis]WSX74714.1 N-acetylmuramoyl-L-alanine amidase [Streptomyces sp. NBC_00899]CAG6391235.1 Peptidoglycan-binding (PGRP) domain of peptidoglycan hydrolases-containing protein [Actinacidiphila cocklensis]